MLGGLAEVGRRTGSCGFVPTEYVVIGEMGMALCVGILLLVASFDCCEVRFLGIILAMAMVPLALYVNHVATNCASVAGGLYLVVHRHTSFLLAGG
ncbi:hypothetical protein V6N12_058205 [Hibiscus sabdariffa]|uniref:Uncharacterized protein n=1 Tax=Hibiscus sabdariffa TaxID=183260 RepID=A0ABR2ERI1_9ROSI